MRTVLSYKRIGIFGGTFDPPHNGHISIAKQARKQFRLDKIYFVPAYIPPHKLFRASSSAKHRLFMINLAINKEKCFEVSDLELKRRGISYTIDTLRAFKKKYPNSEFILIIGADNFIQFRSWKSQNKILGLACLAVYRRKGFNKYLTLQKIEFDPIKGELFNISSTEIRRRVEKGLPISSLVPGSIARYIRCKSLYKRTNPDTFNGKSK